MIRSARICVLAALWAAHVCAEPVVSPQFVQVKKPGVGAVRCVFPRPLTECRVRVTDHTTSKVFDKMLDFGQGPQSASVDLKTWSGSMVATASYEGEGLAQGHCGLRLMVVTYLLVLVECLGRSQEQGWTRGLGLVTSGGWPVLSVNVKTPRYLVASPHSDVAVLLTTSSGKDLDRCSITTPATREVSFPPGGSPPADSRYAALDVTEGRGECGASLSDVTQADAGVWKWEGWQGGAMARQAAVVVVQAAPDGAPALSVEEPTSLRVGSLLQATCRAPPSVPPSKLTWLLDSQVVRSDDGNDTMPDDLNASFPWHGRPVVQTFALRLKEDHVGKKLECRADHASGSRSDSHVLVSTSARLRVQVSSTPAKPSTSSTPATAAKAAGEATCPALSTHSVRVRCSAAGVDVDCGSAPAPRAANALLECREGFRAKGDGPAFLVSVCTQGGRWKPEPLVCELDCGLRRGGAKQLSVGGKEATKSEFPWHVAVFKKINFSYRLVCGGSLVSLKFFVSAAHCFWDNSERRPVSSSLFKAAMGKHTLAWTTEDEDEQRRSVKVVHLPEYFQGYSKRLESDIALVEMRAPFDVTPAVNVVCVDWKSTFEDRQLTRNALGTVPGWGITESNRQSPTLRFVELPFVPFAECRDSVPDGFRDFLVRDKMCGGYRGRTTSVCTGDSGGGFVFPEKTSGSTRYFLRGVVSSSPRGLGSLNCQPQHRTAFTKISFFVKWLEGIVFAAKDPEYDDY